MEWTPWRVTAAVLTTVLAAAACTNRAGDQPPTTSIRTTGVPAATSTGGTPRLARDLHGLIVYSTQAGDIWVMNADGSNRRQVTRTRDPAYDFDPSLSPDGRRVVFRTSRGRYKPDPGGIGAEGIFVIDVATRKERQIQPPQGGLFPARSPDGKRLSYYSGTARDLFVINADGTHARRILRWRGGDSPNAWLPSGQIVFAHWPSDQARRADWYSIRPDGTRLRALPWLRGAGDPLDWLPAR